MMPTTLIACVVLGIAAPAPKDAPKKEAAPNIVGMWTLEKMIMAGTEFPTPALTLEFTSDGHIRDPKRPDVKQSTYKADAGKSPAELDWLLKGKEGPVLRGIYKIEGDTLTLCVEDGFDSKRPDKFESMAGSKRILWTLKRVEKKKD